MVSNHIAETNSKLEQFSALNAEMTDKFIKSTEVIKDSITHSLDHIM